MQVAERVGVLAPVDMVFERFVDLEQSPRWCKSTGVLERRKLTPGTIGVGTEFAAKDRPIPLMTLEFVVSIDDFRANERVSARWTEPVGGGWVATFEERDGTTEVEFVAAMDLTGPLRLIGPVFSSIMKRAIRKDLVRFKEWIEAESPAPTKH